MIKRYEENYAVRDKQDVLAMCALQFAAQVEQKEVSKEMDNEEVQNKLKNYTSWSVNSWGKCSYKYNNSTAYIITKFGKLNTIPFGRVSQLCRALSFRKIIEHFVSPKLVLQGVYNLS